MEPPLDDSCPDCGDVCGNLMRGMCGQADDLDDDREPYFDDEDGVDR